ncbi:acyl-protein synthetase LuxE [Nonlabens dokdonensis]|uniref:Acyl-protein synthetase LuxE n=2 Tax=Nonlabens dokdonensis TaxID=328515 RepID=A0ABX5Q1D6_9FLAO|nr:ACP synthase [Nonlabens dokdonensis]AGC76183.1 putative acyl protein synthase/acyl-CoA reductase-like protein [Nonlabens dokdonensis DSW-6]PZX43852.1 acyl-protein synthetase LuxE [Nonlabens dokdonensis]
MRFPVFTIDSKQAFEKTALEIYRYQLQENKVYSQYCRLINRTEAKTIEEIPFLPIQFFKSHPIISNNRATEITFTSSGTTGSTVSKHHVTDLKVYDLSLDHSFEQTYGNIEDYVILALLPHYLDRTGSSLVYMAQRWINHSKRPESGFYLNNLKELSQVLENLQKTQQKVILIGVTFALLQLAENHAMPLENTIIIETGGMKGMRKEIVKPELHQILRKAFPKASIQSEYGMTELLSQAYASDGINFTTPPWMKVFTRDTNDPLAKIGYGKTGGLNIIDLANYNSCSFIATQDLGKSFQDGSFQVLGRFDHSDIRGCNLMAVDQ